jgi:two-component system, LytTR family, response regulator
MPERLRVLIVDDEPVARALLRELLAESPGVEVVGEAATGREAIAAISKLEPDVVFLDIEMPGGDGFSIIEAIGVDAMPAIVFVTAHEEHALKAFDVVAADYLLKPLEPQRLRRTLDRLRARDAAGRARPREPRGEGGGAPAYADRLAVDAGTHLLLIPTADVDRLEAAGKHTRVHARGRSYMRREGLSELARRLDPREFIRVHRSTVVRIDRVREVHGWFRGAYSIVLTDGTRLTTGGTYRAAIEDVLLGRQRPPR